MCWVSDPSVRSSRAGVSRPPHGAHLAGHGICICMYVYIYIYIYVCIDMCIYYTCYIYIYIYT